MIALLQKRWIYHSLIWLLVTILFSFIGLKSGESIHDIDFWRSLVAIISSFMLVSYLAFYTKRRFFDQRNYLLFALGFIITITLSTLYLQSFSSIFGIKNNISENIQNNTFIFVIVIGLQYFKRGIINQYQLQELRAKNAESELNALKTQINPHFLFNTLNNIYGINQINAEKGSEMIMELSEVMRYHLRFSKMKTISLEDEIQLIKSYIELEKLRLNNNCQLDIDLKVKDNHIQIAPLLLLPFIENAFKHGTHSTQPCFIKMNLKTDKDKLDFEISNSIFQHKKTVKTNIGLANTQKRLELIYPNRHKLSIQKTSTIYTTQITIEL